MHFQITPTILVRYWYKESSFNPHLIALVTFWEMLRAEYGSFVAGCGKSVSYSEWWRLATAAMSSWCGLGRREVVIVRHAPGGAGAGAGGGGNYRATVSATGSHRPEPRAAWRHVCSAYKQRNRRAAERQRKCLFYDTRRNNHHLHVLLEKQKNSANDVTRIISNQRDSLQSAIFYYNLQAMYYLLSI